ncbi:MAG: KEOPS complex subunit Cgi121 [Candidatus Thorarchaeota archaeon]
MLIEELQHGENTYHVGIAVLQNEKQLATAQIVSIAKELAGDVLAIQFLNPVPIAGHIHLLSAVQNALNAWLGGYAISRSLDVEIILYASAQRQISRALELFGVRDDMKHIAVIVVGSADAVRGISDRLNETIGSELTDPLPVSEERYAQIASVFDISPSEVETIASGTSLKERFEALARCVVSRVSMLALDT